MTGLDEFRSELERELIAAAYRKTHAPEPIRRTAFGLTPIFGAAAAAMIAVVVAVGIFLAIPETSSAQVFRIERFDTGTTLDVVDVVNDPDEVIAQLRDEADITAELFAVPVTDELVGQLVAVGSTGNVAPNNTLNKLGYIDQVHLTNDFEGILVIEYGRPADGDEFYAATTTDPICAELAEMTPARAVAQLQSNADDVRLELIDRDGTLDTHLTADDIPPTSTLVNVVFLNTRTLVATFQDGTTDPTNRSCQ